MSLIAVSLSLLCLAVGSSAQKSPERGLPHASPCPAVYSYGWEPSGGWHGVITIVPPARFSEVQLVLRMTVPYYRPEAGVGRVEVKGGTAEIQAISRRAYRGEGQKVQFMIVFPPFDDVPRVKEIYINGKSFCAANQVYADTRSTIELKYTLRTGLSLPLANGNDFSVFSPEPTRPDLVTVAILRPATDEARPTVSSPLQGPPRRPGEQKGPCKCNKTRDSEDEDLPMQHRPENHVFHAFRPPRPGVGGDVGDMDATTSVSRPGDYTPPPFTSVNRPPPGVSPGSGNVGNTKRPPPFSSGGSGNGGNNRPAPASGNNIRPPPANGNNIRPAPSNGNNIRPPPANGNNIRPQPASGNNIRPPPANGNNIRPQPASGNTKRPPPANGHKPIVSNQNEEVDDKIYFIMTESDEVNSPRIIKLLEHLLVISKKHYLVDLERLQIEKKRLALEKYPHYTFIV